MVDSARAGSSGLRRFAVERGGVSAQEAHDRAELMLTGLADKARRSIEFDSACLTGYAALADKPPPRAVIEELHRLATELEVVAGQFGRVGVSEAARGLRVSIEAAPDDFKPSWLKVFSDGIAKLAGSCVAEEQERLLASLRTLGEHVTAMINA